MEIKYNKGTSDPIGKGGWRETLRHNHNDIAAETIRQPPKAIDSEVPKGPARQGQALSVHLCAGSYIYLIKPVSQPSAPKSSSALAHTSSYMA